MDYDLDSETRMMLQAAAVQRRQHRRRLLARFATLFGSSLGTLVFAYYLSRH